METKREKNYSCLQTLRSHKAQVYVVKYNKTGEYILSGS